LLKLKQENKFQKTKTILQERWNKRKKKKKKLKSCLVVKTNKTSGENKINK